MSANIMTKLPNGFAWLEKQVLVVMTCFTLFLMIVNGYLMLGHRYNEDLILQQSLLVMICLSLFFIATRLHYFKRYSLVFRIVMIILIMIAVGLFLLYQHYFQSLYSHTTSQLWIQSDRFYALVLFLFATLIFGILPFVLAYEQEPLMMHNIIISFCLLPVVITALTLYMYDHLDSIITIYGLDLTIMQHKIKLSLLFGCTVWIVMMICQQAYQKLVQYFPKITGVLMLLITISYIGILIYIVVNADQLRMLIAVSFW